MTTIKNITTQKQITLTYREEILLINSDVYLELYEECTSEELKALILDLDFELQSKIMALKEIIKYTGISIIRDAYKELHNNICEINALIPYLKMLL